MGHQFERSGPTNPSSFAQGFSSTGSKLSHTRYTGGASYPRLLLKEKLLARNACCNLQALSQAACCASPHLVPPGAGNAHAYVHKTR
eukprot:6133222-Amphidinium_carterae.1